MVSMFPCCPLPPPPPAPPSPALAEWNNHLIRSLTKHQSWCKANMKSEPPECEIYLSTNLKHSPRTLRYALFAAASSEPLWSYITQRRTRKYSMTARSEPKWFLFVIGNKWHFNYAARVHVVIAEKLYNSPKETGFMRSETTLHDTWLECN